MSGLGEEFKFHRISSSKVCYSIIEGDLGFENCYCSTELS